MEAFSPKRADRIPAAVPVIFRRGDEAGVRARTRNVSETGAFIETDVLPPGDAELLLEFACGRIFVVKGQVARVADEPWGRGMGVRFDQQRWHPELKAEFLDAVKKSGTVQEGSLLVLRSFLRAKKHCPACDYVAPPEERSRTVCPNCWTTLK